MNHYQEKPAIGASGSLRPRGSACVVFRWDRPQGAIAFRLEEHSRNWRTTFEDLPFEGELLLFRPGARASRRRGTHPVLMRFVTSYAFPLESPVLVHLRFWLQEGDEGEAERQTEETNAVLAGGAGVDSGIRVVLREIVSVRDPIIHSPKDLGCLRTIDAQSREPDTVDVYLHRVEWPCRACPSERRIFLSRPRLTRYGLAHELMHLLGMPECAHVDENAYLSRGNVMERWPLGGEGKLTVGQLCIMNLSRDSLVAQLRSREEPDFELLQCLDVDGEPVDAPNLGLQID